MMTVTSRAARETSTAELAAYAEDQTVLAIKLPCAGSDCHCGNTADCGTVKHPICGCRLADRPDVHEPEGRRVDSPVP